MVELIALFFLCRHIGSLAERKGLPRGQWMLFNVLAWIACEFTGAVIWMMLFGFNKNDLLGIMGFSLACAFGGYLIIKAILDKKPDAMDEDNINNIGRN